MEKHLSSASIKISFQSSDSDLRILFECSDSDLNVICLFQRERERNWRKETKTQNVNVSGRACIPKGVPLIYSFLFYSKPGPIIHGP